MSGTAGLLPELHGNATLIVFHELCTLDVCDLSLAQMKYLPSIPGNAVFALIFAVCFAVQVLLGIKHRTWMFMVATTLGCLLEMVGYNGRIMINSDPFSKIGFLVYFIPLTIAPIFFTTAISLCLAKIAATYGEEKSRPRLRICILIFCCCDSSAMVFQAIGSAIARTTNMYAQTQTGIQIMRVGLFIQVASLLLCVVACVEFATQIYRHSRVSVRHIYTTNNPTGAHGNSTVTAPNPLRSSLLFKIFLSSLAVSILAMVIRSIFRLASLFSGFNSSLSAIEFPFLLLDATPMTLAVILLSMFHPGVCFPSSFSLPTRNTVHFAGHRNNTTRTSTTTMEVKVVEPKIAYARAEALERQSSESETSFDDVASIRIASWSSDRRLIRAGEAQKVNMSPSFGLRYEDTCKNYPRPKTGDKKWEESL